MTYKFIWFGNPISKKNSINLVDIGRQCPTCRRRAKSIPLPSKAFKAYEKAVSEQLRLTSYQRLTGPVAVRCVYYMATARIPDLCNLLAATHDILQNCGVIADDKQIVSVDGSRIVGKDKDPRVEITIEDFSLAPDEVPIIAQKGERTLKMRTKNDPT